MDNYGENNIGWINSKKLEKYTLKPVHKVLIRYAGVIGYVTPIVDAKLEY